MGGEPCSLLVQSNEGHAAQRQHSPQLLPGLSPVSRISSRSPFGGATHSCGTIGVVRGEDKDAALSCDSRRRC